MPPLSTTIQPGDGFYQYVNQSWLNKTNIPDSVSEYGVFEEIKEDNNKKLNGFIDSLGEKVPKVGEIPESYKDDLRFFSYIWHNSKFANEEAFVKVLIGQLMFSSDCSDRHPNQARMVGWLCAGAPSSFIDIGTEEEKRPPYHIRNSLSPTNLTLPVKYYLDKHLHADPIWKAYTHYIHTCAIELGLPFLHRAAAVEIELAAIIGKSTNEDLYKILNGKQLVNWMPQFYWDEFMEGAGIPGWKKRIWIVNDPVCLKRVMNWICHLGDEDLVAICTLQILNASAEHLRGKIRDAHFNLFSRQILGIKRPMAKKEQYLEHISKSLPDALCKGFSTVDGSSKKLKEITEMVHKIKESAIEYMRDNHTLAKRATSLTLEKIHRMGVTIGTPDKTDIPRTAYFPDSILHTKFSAYDARAKLKLAEVGKPVDPNVRYPCFVVNASYYQEKNHFMIPWGIIQAPFYYEDAPLGWNYGGIGDTIGHELTHAFDREGSEYNPRGKFKRWWTHKDRAHFKQRTRKMEKFFSKFKHCGKHLNGEKTLSENWADFGGLVFSLRSLKKDLDKAGAKDEERRAAMRTFFISYAVSWRDRVRRKGILNKIAKSVHSLAEDRVDRMVPHFQEWVDAFDVKEGDRLFIPVKDRLKFF